MTLYTRQYTKLLSPEKRVPRSQIRPRNIYRIVTYKGGEPATKTAETVETTKPRGESDSYAANMGRSQARRRKRGRGTVLASAMGTQDTLG